MFALHFLHLLYQANSWWFSSCLALTAVPERAVCMIIISSIILNISVTSTSREFSPWPPGGQRMSFTYVLVAQHPWWRTCCSVNVSSGCLLLLLLLLLQWQTQRIFLSKRVIEFKVKCRIERKEGSLESGREGSNRDSQNTMAWVRLKSTTDSLLNWWGERIYLRGEWQKIKNYVHFL